MKREPIRDPINDEVFSRVVGKRQRPVIGDPPSAEARGAMARMATYRTAAPKGVFRYRSHEEANRARDAWTVARALAYVATPEIRAAGNSGEPD